MALLRSVVSVQIVWEMKVTALTVAPSGQFPHNLPEFTDMDGRLNTDLYYGRPGWHLMSFKFREAIFSPSNCTFYNKGLHASIITFAD
jgi:hypothetical protein